MAQFFVQFSGFFDSEPLRIHTNCQQATYVKYNYCLFTIFRKSWKLFCTRTSLANSGPLFATTQQPKMCTHNKKAFDWLLLSFGFFFDGDFVRIHSQCSKEFFSQKYIFLVIHQKRLYADSGIDVKWYLNICCMNTHEENCCFAL